MAELAIALQWHGCKTVRKASVSSRKLWPPVSQSTWPFEEIDDVFMSKMRVSRKEMQLSSPL
jgi:hypothetical protein